VGFHIQIFLVLMIVIPTLGAGIHALGREERRGSRDQVAG
jgi:hypothetical protein